MVGKHSLFGVFELRGRRLERFVPVVPVVGVPGDMRPRVVDRAKVKAARKVSARVRRKR